MSVETRGIIRESDIITVQNFIASAMNGSIQSFASGGENDCIIKLNFVNREMKLIEHTWGKEDNGTFINKKGDIYLRFGCFGQSDKIMLFILSYFGGWYLYDDASSNDYSVIKKNKRKCLSLYFQLERKDD